MYFRANNIQRFCAYVLDFLIIGIVYSLIISLIYSIIKYDSSTVDNLYSVMLGYYQEILQGNQAQMDKFYEATMELLKYYGFQLAISIPVYLVLDLLYLVVLPTFWKKQTIGRLFMNCKVVKINGKLTYKTLLLREIVGTFLFYQVFGYFGIIISIIIVICSGRSIVDIISKTALVTTRAYITLNQQNNQYNNYNSNNYNNDFNSNNQNETNQYDYNDNVNNDSSDDNDDNNDDYRII